MDKRRNYKLSQVLEKGKLEHVVPWTCAE